MILGWAAIVVAGIAALCFVAYLLFLRFVINKTGGTEGLADVAKAMSAYRVPLPSRNPRPASHTAVTEPSSGTHTYSQQSVGDSLHSPINDQHRRKPEVHQ